MKKNNNLLIALIAIVFVCLVGVVSYSLLNNNKENNNKDNLDNNTEVEITSSEVKDSLDEKIKILEIDFEMDIYRYASIYKNENITNSEMSKKDKLFKVLSYLYFKTDNYKSPVTTDYNFGSMENYKDIMVQLDEKDVLKLYSNMYGEEVSGMSIEGGCPNFIYDKDNKKYYGSAECGGTTASSLDIYKYKYTSDKDNYYVYLSLGSGTLDKDGEPLCYIDYNRTLEVDCENIGQNNYQDYSQYKYTFTKDDNGDYAFSKLEKIK